MVTDMQDPDDEIDNPGQPLENKSTIEILMHLGATRPPAGGKLDYLKGITCALVMDNWRETTDSKSCRLEFVTLGRNKCQRLLTLLDGHGIKHFPIPDDDRRHHQNDEAYFNPETKGFDKRPGRRGTTVTSLVHREAYAAAAEAVIALLGAHVVDARGDTNCSHHGGRDKLRKKLYDKLAQACEERRAPNFRQF